MMQTRPWDLGRKCVRESYHDGGSYIHFRTFVESDVAQHHASSAENGVNGHHDAH